MQISSSPCVVGVVALSTHGVWSSCTPVPGAGGAGTGIFSGVDGGRHVPSRVLRSLDDAFARRAAADPLPHGVEMVLRERDETAARHRGAGVHDERQVRERLRRELDVEVARVGLAGLHELQVRIVVRRLAETVGAEQLFVRDRMGQLEIVLRRHRIVAGAVVAAVAAFEDDGLDRLEGRT
jgi:hypothetical protein